MQEISSFVRPHRLPHDGLHAVLHPAADLDDRGRAGWRRTVARTCAIAGISAAAWFATSLGATAHADGLDSLVGDVSSTAGAVVAPVASAAQPAVAAVSAPAAQVVSPVVQVAAPVVAAVAAPVAPVVTPVVTPVAAPVQAVAAPVVQAVAAPVAAVAKPVAAVVKPVAAAVAPVTAPVAPVIAPVEAAVAPVIAPVTAAVAPVTAAVAPVTTAVAPITAAVAPVVAATAPVVAATTPAVDVIAPGVAPMISPVVSATAPVAAPLGQSMTPATGAVAPTGTAVSIFPSILGSDVPAFLSAEAVTATDLVGPAVGQWFSPARSDAIATVPARWFLSAATVGSGTSFTAAEIGSPALDVAVAATLSDGPVLAADGTLDLDGPTWPATLPSTPLPVAPLPVQLGANAAAGSTSDHGHQPAAAFDDFSFHQQLRLLAALAVSDDAALSAPADEPGNSPG